MLVAHTTLLEISCRGSSVFCLFVLILYVLVNNLTHGYHSCSFYYTSLWTWWLSWSCDQDHLGLTTEKSVFRGVVSNKGADQPAHLCSSLISAFVILFLENVIPKLATSEFSIFYLVSVAEQASFGITWLQTPKTDFHTLSPI